MNNRHCTCFIISYSGTKPTFEKPKVLWAYNHRSALLLYGKSAVQLIFGIYQDRSAILIEPGTISWFAHYKNSRTLIGAGSEMTSPVFSRIEDAHLAKRTLFLHCLA